MRKRGGSEYKARVTDESSLTRGHVPCPLLTAMGARPGDYIIFRLSDSNKVVMRLSRARKKSDSKRR